MKLETLLRALRKCEREQCDYSDEHIEALKKFCLYRQAEIVSRRVKQRKRLADRIEKRILRMYWNEYDWCRFFKKYAEKLKAEGERK